jgi:hypothetical protein
MSRVMMITRAGDSPSASAVARWMASSVRIGSGKRTSGAGENRFSDAHDVATPGKSLQGEQRCPMLLGRDPPREVRAKNSAAGFGDRQSGCDPLSRATDGGFRGPIALDHSRNQGT